MSTPARFALVILLLLCGVVTVAAFPGGAPSAESAAATKAGTVLETMNAGGYTYVRLETDAGEIWAAGPETALAVGDRVGLGASATMTNFRSESLDRTFPSIEFVSAFVTPPSAGEGRAAMAQAHGGARPTAPTTVEAVAKAESGSTIAELYAGKAGLAGKTVTVRGQVVKYNSNILGHNWIHIQDGSGTAGTNDLTVTTEGTARVGDVVLVRGKVALDKDFGMGYRYDLLVEEATVTVE